MRRGWPSGHELPLGVMRTRQRPQESDEEHQVLNPDAAQRPLPSRTRPHFVLRGIRRWGLCVIVDMPANLVFRCQFSRSDAFVIEVQLMLNAGTALTGRWLSGVPARGAMTHEPEATR